LLHFITLERAITNHDAVLPRYRDNVTGKEFIAICIGGAGGAWPFALTINDEQLRQLEPVDNEWVWELDFSPTALGLLNFGAWGGVGGS
jgi:hypothetical protein